MQCAVCVYVYRLSAVSSSGSSGVVPLSYVSRVLCVGSVLFEYVGDANAGCLSVAKGDDVIIISREDENWYKAVHNAKVGLVPRSYIKEP